MSIHVVEDLHRRAYAFTDPDAFLSCDNSCDNPACLIAWVTGSARATWPLADERPSGSCFMDLLVVSCSADCLRSASGDRGRVRH